MVRLPIAAALLATYLLGWLSPALVVPLLFALLLFRSPQPGRGRPPRRGGYVTPLVSRYTNPTTGRIPTPTGTSTGCKPDGQTWGEPVSRALQARLSSVTAPTSYGDDTDGHPGLRASTADSDYLASQLAGLSARLNDIPPTPCAGCPETPA